MFTARECLVKAEEMEAYGLTCAGQSQRDDYASVGRGWRRSAKLADAHERRAAISEARSEAISSRPR